MKSFTWKCLGALVVIAGFAAGNAGAQAPAAPAPKTEGKLSLSPADEAAKPAAAAPALPAGSTAAPGWNVPPKWDTVQESPQYASIPGVERNVLQQQTGEWWRTVRNGPVTFYGGIVLLVVPIFLLAFFAIKGPFKLHGEPTGRLVERYNSAERMTHWTTAISFVLLGLTGLIILFGKHVLLPWMGPAAFSWITIIGKNIHNFVGPLFIFSLIAMFVLYVKDNFFNAQDFVWLAKFGGLMSGNHVPSGRFNGGEKVWFWLGVVILGSVVAISGVIMLFPNWETVRGVMAEANLFHAVVAMIFVASSFGHMYIGTIGEEGASQGMLTGYSDETWAREHHPLWLEEVKAGKRPEKMMSASAQAAAGDD
ncbi:MAG TPA: formate dehydrogenase subunit gamma [Usitatibacteraceae bacterium]